jgi:gamma-glutamylcyclotransferase (GGCT)/AIG2-like uncharacterized protein YtfP
MTGASPTCIFVYGTLKRGEVRERCWTASPIAVEPATVRGALYDLGPYPALVEGDDTVAGELWQIASADMHATLVALDRVEGFAGRDDDLYRRLIVDCQTAVGSTRGWTYKMASAAMLTAAKRIIPNDRGICVWSRHSTS